MLIYVYDLHMQNLCVYVYMHESLRYTQKIACYFLDWGSHGPITGQLVAPRLVAPPLVGIRIAAYT